MHNSVGAEEYYRGGGVNRDVPACRAGITSVRVIIEREDSVICLFHGLFRPECNFQMTAVNAEKLLSRHPCNINAERLKYSVR